MISDAVVEKRAYQKAIEAAIAASRLVLKYWPRKLNTHFDGSLKNELFQKKGAGNYATSADKASENLIAGLIRMDPLFHHHSILGEEIEKQKTKGTYQWVLDPIDGTMNFAHGLKDFGINIALMKNYVPIIGVMAFPAYGIIISAIKSKGAFYQKIGSRKKIKVEVSWNGTLKTSLIAYDLGYAHRKRQLMQYISPIADKIEYPVCFACVSASVQHVVFGAVGGYFNRKATIFDVAAPIVIIQEAGGIVTQWNGQAIDCRKKTSTLLVAASPSIHRALLKILK